MQRCVRRPHHKHSGGARSQSLKDDLPARLAECDLELHPVKTRIVSCKDARRKAVYPNVTFDFPRILLRLRLVKNASNHQLFWGFNPAVSPAALNNRWCTIRDLRFLRKTDLAL
jgi:hypothetical protein